MIRRIKRSPNGRRGMTLIEVLVAMVVMSTAAASLMILLSIQTTNTISIRERMLARLAAEILMVEIVSGAPGDTRSSNSGVVEVGGVPLAWQIRRTAFAIEGVQQVTVTVRRDADDTEQEQVLAELATLRPQ